MKSELFALLLVILASICVSGQPDKAAMESKNNQAIAENQKIEQRNAALAAAVVAVNAGDYERAIAEYERAISLMPSHPASVEARYNKVVAHARYGTGLFVAADNLSDAAKRKAQIAKAKVHFSAADADAAKLIPLLKGDPALEKYVGQTSLMRATVLWMLVTQYGAGDRLADTAAAYEDFFNRSSVQATILEGRRNLLDMFFKAKQYDKAVAQAEKIVAVVPNDLDGNYYLGIILAANDGDADRKRGAIHLKRYLAAAPMNDSGRADAIALLDILKNMGVTQ